MSRRRALVIGLDGYPTQPLKTACNDARRMAGVLRTNGDGSPNWQVSLVLGVRGADPTWGRQALMSRLTKFFQQAGDTHLLLYFSGHAVRSPWGTSLASQDGLSAVAGISFNDLMALIDGARAATVTVILDCCYSGDLGNDRASDLLDPGRSDPAQIPLNVTILSSSRAEEASAEGVELSLFTELLVDGLGGVAGDHTGAITALGLFEHATYAMSDWDQTPQLKTNATGLPHLRMTAPAMSPEKLRKLPEAFPSKEHRIRLMPEHEGEGRPLPAGVLGTPEQQLFDYLAELRNNGLVDSDSKRSHYWIAMHNQEVFLSEKGKYFWKLAKMGKF